ncbi:MAG TPA: hypothetical protein VFO10_29135 [Oligoflexus sp.]|uniref:hypothetical protein n=1 Tax=Oligoflexus sp. TaxID=1971216 RepID=UPI002D80F9A9|nr:hypothetical protein [Oligoflexus sp.]HET9241366.1 hypothetical protein [Oligoflexus sp.]
MQRIATLMGSAWLLTACGGTNFNAFFTSEEQKKAQDQLRIEAQYEYDQGNNDKALEITGQILKMNPYEEKTLILRSYAFLSKAGLDAFSLSKNLIDQADNKDTSSTTGDKTSDNLNQLADVIGLSDADFDELGTKNTSTLTTLYYPKTRAAARESLSEIISNIGNAVDTLCPIIQAGAPKDSTKDPRHECEASPLELQGRAQSHFAWALAHLGEAIAFYSVVLYDDGTVGADGKPLGANLQRVSASLNPNGDVNTFLTELTALTNAINAIFPTGDAAAADSMLNAMFNDMKVTSLSFAAMGGVPDSVTKSIDESITNLEAKIAKISSSTDSGATSDAAKQNAAVRNALTTQMADQLNTKITALPPEQKTQACELYKSINSDPAKRPTGCPP